MKAQHLNEPGYFDLQALAVYSCCSVRWLRGRLSDRTCPIPCYRIEGKILVKREEFDQWMMRHRTVQPTQDLDELVESVVSQVQQQGRLTVRGL